MNIAEMHVWFRQYAQQMGMQNVRAILPEQIDLLINTSISDTINQIITQNIGMTNDRVITDNSKISQINALRSLYKVLTVSFDDKVSTNSTQVPNSGIATASLSGGMAEGSGEPTTKDIFTIGEETTTRRVYADIKDLDKKGRFDCLFLVDLAINYKKADNSITNYFPIRLIDDAFLADTLNDFILKPKLRSPIAVVYNNQLDIYIDDLVNDSLPTGVLQNKLRLSYIAKPAKVAYLVDLGGTNVDCDLPEHMHIDILKHAVDLYRISVNGALSASQQAEQNQQRENARNNYRNEGNQQNQ